MEVLAPTISNLTTCINKYSIKMPLTKITLLKAAQYEGLILTQLNFYKLNHRYPEKKQGPPNYFCLSENASRKLLNIFSNFFKYFKVQSFRLRMENNFIQTAASASHAVAYLIGPIFKHIDCVQLYFTNGFTNIEY